MSCSANRTVVRSRGLVALSVAWIVFALLASACVSPVTQTLSRAEQALAEGKYSEAVALLAELADRCPEDADVSRRLDQARMLVEGEKAFLDAQGAVEAQDYSWAASLLCGIGPEHPRQSDAQALLAQVEQAEQERMLELFRGNWNLPLDRETRTFRLDGPAGAVLFATVGTEWAGDGSLPVLLTYESPSGTRTGFSGEVWTYWDEGFPAVFLPDGRIVVQAAVWDPLAPHEPVQRPVGGLLLGWDVNPSGTRMAVATMVDHGENAPRTFDTVVVDLGTWETQVIDSYDPGWSGDWMGQLLTIYWLDDDTVRYERLLTRESEYATWTAP